MRWLTRQLKGLSLNSRLIVFATRRLAYLNTALRSGVSAADIHQVEHTTKRDRYPDVFEAARSYFESTGKQPSKILSFGCSTGDECFTLRTYFADSFIVGADINKVSLSIAESQRSDKNIKFVASTASNLAELGPFDAIFAMSVLCRWPETKFLRDSSAIYPFDKFSKTIALLDSCLSPEGLFVIVNANYRFNDAICGYTIVRISDRNDWIPKFDTNNKRIEKSENAEGEFIFKKN